MNRKSVAWDRQLTKEEIFRLSPRDAKTRLVTSLERKVLFLEDVVMRRHIAWDVIKKFAGSRTALRQWEDPRLRHWKWSITNADAFVDEKTGKDGSNLALMNRWKAAIELIKNPEVAVLKRSDPSTPSVELTRQNLALIARNAFLEAELLKLMRKSK